MRMLPLRVTVTSYKVIYPSPLSIQKSEFLFAFLNRGAIYCSPMSIGERIRASRISERKDTGFKIILQGDNPASESIEITRADRLRVVGIVRKIMRDPDGAQL